MPGLFYQLVQSRNKTHMTNTGAVHPDTRSVQAKFEVEITSRIQRNLHGLSVLNPINVINVGY